MYGLTSSLWRISFVCRLIIQPWQDRPSEKQLVHWWSADYLGSIRVSTYLPLCQLCSLPPISLIGALLDIYYTNIATLLLPTIFTFPYYPLYPSALKSINYPPQLFKLQLAFYKHLLPINLISQMTVATADHCHPQLPISDWSVPMITVSHDLHCQDHLPLSISIVPSWLGSVVLTVASPCNHSVFPAFYLPPFLSYSVSCSIYVLLHSPSTVDPLSLWLNSTPSPLYPTVYKSPCRC